MSLTDEERERISEYLRLTDEEFCKRYTDTNKDSKIGPCQFLKDKKCSIYEVRQEGCRKYPFTNTEIFGSILSNARKTVDCPAAFHIIDTLRREYQRDFVMHALISSTLLVSLGADLVSPSSRSAWINIEMVEVGE